MNYQAYRSWLLQVIDHIDKISTSRKCSFLLAAQEIFSAKISGTFKRYLFLSSLFFFEHFARGG